MWSTSEKQWIRRRTISLIWEQYWNNSKRASSCWEVAEKVPKRLTKYISQHTVLGFNSQKYDVPLIRPYLPASLTRKEDNNPEQVIKKTNGYLWLATAKLKFLDITNYLASGTNLAQFYQSFEVSTPKGSFPYEWFNSVEKFKYTGPQFSVLNTWNAG